MTHVQTVGAIILAAGKGRRAGTPKLTLCIDGKSYLQTIGLRLLDCGIRLIVVVVAAEHEEWATKELPEASIVVNPDPERGMMSSIATAIAVMPQTEGVMIVPVDHPVVAGEIYQLLCEAFEKDTTHIVKPVYEGKAGHPVIVPRWLAEKIPVDDRDGGLQLFLHQSGVATCMLTVDDCGILQNMNGPL